MDSNDLPSSIRRMNELTVSSDGMVGSGDFLVRPTLKAGGIDSVQLGFPVIEHDDYMQIRLKDKPRFSSLVMSKEAAFTVNRGQALSEKQPRRFSDPWQLLAPCHI